jgi:hypothetical protein
MSMKPALLLAVVSLWCLIGAVAGSMAREQTASGTTTVVQMSYYALPGKEQEVLSIRLSACDVLEKKRRHPRSRADTQRRFAGDEAWG